MNERYGGWNSSFFSFFALLFFFGAALNIFIFPTHVLLLFQVHQEDGEFLECNRYFSVSFFFSALDYAFFPARLIFRIPAPLKLPIRQQLFKMAYCVVGLQNWEELRVVGGGHRRTGNRTNSDLEGVGEVREEESKRFDWNLSPGGKFGIFDCGQPLPALNSCS